MPAGRPKKEFHEYLCEPTGSHVSHQDYLSSPATAFLKHTIEAKSAIDLCVRSFPKNQGQTYTKNSLDSLQHLSLAVLPTIMGHFETFQRYLFAGMFDLTVYLNKFKVKTLLDKISKDNNSEIKVDLERLSAFRNIGTSSIGLVVADNLKGWHDPDKVNAYFNAFKLDHQFYSNEDCKRLKVLWQLRHSIVHTGGTISFPDAEKIDDLNLFGDKTISFENNFIYEVSRKFHPLVKSGTIGIGNKFKAQLKPSLPGDTLERIDKFFEVKSSIAAWLR